jgi:hypothetical protein
MDHIAIMKKSWKLIPKILSGEKKIESRWGVNKCAPWGKAKAGDTIYFKNSGEPITVKAKVLKVEQFENLTHQKIKEIINKINGDMAWAKNKHYCTLIYLTEVEEVKPFNINKKGFGSAAAWLTIPNITKIKVV